MSLGRRDRGTRLFAEWCRPASLHGYVFASIELAASQIETIDPAALPAGWDAPVTGPSSRSVGDDWISAGRTLALAVPSVVMPGELNDLINPAHPDFASAKVSAAAAFAHDPRLA